MKGQESSHTLAFGDHSTGSRPLGYYARQFMIPELGIPTAVQVHIRVDELICADSVPFHRKCLSLLTEQRLYTHLRGGFVRALYKS